MNYYSKVKFVSVVEQETNRQLGFPMADSVHEIRPIYKRVNMEKIDENVKIKSVKNAIRTLTPVL